MKDTDHYQEKKKKAQLKLSNVGSMITIDAKWVRNYLADKFTCLQIIKYFKIGKKFMFWEIFTH